MSRSIVVVEASLLAIEVFLFVVFLLTQIKKKERIYGKIRKKWWFQPNTISGAGTLLMVLSWILYLLGNSKEIIFASVFLFVSAAFLDKLDGFVARNFNLVTDRGKRLDPILDKVNSLPPLLYWAIRSSWGTFMWCIIAVSDLTGEKVRKWLTEKGLDPSSNIWGKIKTPTYYTTVVLCAAISRGTPWVAFLFGICAILSVASCLAKIPKGRKKEFLRDLGDQIPSSLEGATMVAGILLTKFVKWK